MKKLQKEKQKEVGEKEDKILRNLKRESEIWRYINKKKRKRENKRNRIKKEQWREYFMELLGGMEEITLEK